MQPDFQPGICSNLWINFFISMLIFLNVHIRRLNSNVSNRIQQQFLTSSKSVKLILWRSLSSSAWSGTDIWVVYLMWGKEWGVRALLRPAPGVDSGEISFVRRLSTTAAESFFLFFSEDLLAFFCCTPQSWSKANAQTLLIFVYFSYISTDVSHILYRAFKVF